MKINKKLIESAGFNPTKKTYQISVSSICEKIENNEITLPLYQRDVSWTLKKSVDLLNYQLLGKAPVAPISINEINKVENKNDYVTQVSFINREIIEEIKKGQLSVTDGQQRLTTNFKAYINDNGFRNIVLDLAKGNFLIVEDAIKKFQIPVGILLNKDMSIFLEYINQNSTLKKPECMNLLMIVRNKLRDYSYTINLAEDLTEDEQIEWFEVLNNAGSRVTRIQMRFSKLKAEGIDIYTQYTNKFINRIEESNMNSLKIKTTEVSIPIATLNCAYEVITGKEHTANYTPIPSDTRENQICTLESQELKKSFELTLNALDRTIEFIEDNSLVIPDRIDYITYLTGFFVFKGERELSDKQERELVNWYKTVVFTNKSNSERRDLFSNLIKIIN